VSDEEGNADLEKVLREVSMLHDAVDREATGENRLVDRFANNLFFKREDRGDFFLFQYKKRTKSDKKKIYMYILLYKKNKLNNQTKKNEEPIL